MNAPGRETTILDRSGRRLRWLLMGGIAASAGLVFLMAPGALGYTCPFFSLTGHSCFSCGLTRSLHSAVHGDIGTALHYHLMGPLLLVVSAAWSAIWVFEAWTGAKVQLRRGTAKIALAGLAGLWLVFGTVRLTMEVLGR